MALPRFRSKPEEMTTRARLWLFVAAVQNLALGAYCVLTPERFGAKSFEEIRAVADMPRWGVLFLAAGLCTTWAMLRRSEGHARGGLILSAAVAAAWAIGFMAAADGASIEAATLVAPTGPIVWWSLVAKDLIVVWQPMRSPFEPILRRLEQARRADER